MRRFWLSYPEPNQALERTAHSAGFLAVFGPVPVGCRSPPAFGFTEGGSHDERHIDIISTG